MNKVTEELIQQKVEKIFKKKFLVDSLKFKVKQSNLEAQEQLSHQNSKENLSQLESKIKGSLPPKKLLEELKSGISLLGQDSKLSSLNFPKNKIGKRKITREDLKKKVESVKSKIKKVQKGAFKTNQKLVKEKIDKKLDKISKEQNLKLPTQLKSEQKKASNRVGKFFKKISTPFRRLKKKSSLEQTKTLSNDSDRNDLFGYQNFIDQLKFFFKTIIDKVESYNNKRGNLKNKLFKNGFLSKKEEVLPLANQKKSEDLDNEKEFETKDKIDKKKSLEDKIKGKLNKILKKEEEENLLKLKNNLNTEFTSQEKMSEEGSKKEEGAKSKIKDKKSDKELNKEKKFPKQKKSSKKKNSTILSSPNASVDTPVSAEPSSGLKEVKGSERGSDGTGSPPRTSSPSAPSSASIPNISLEQKEGEKEEKERKLVYDGDRNSLVWLQSFVNQLKNFFKTIIDKIRTPSEQSSPNASVGTPVSAEPSSGLKEVKGSERGSDGTGSPPRIPPPSAPSASTFLPQPSPIPSTPTPSEQSSPNASVDTPVSAEPSSGLKEVKGSERGSDGTGSPPRIPPPSAPSASTFLPQPSPIPSTPTPSEQSSPNASVDTPVSAEPSSGLKEVKGSERGSDGTGSPPRIPPPSAPSASTFLPQPSPIPSTPTPSEQSSPNASVDTPVSAEPSSGLKEVKGSERGSDGTGSPPRIPPPSAPSASTFLPQPSPIPSTPTPSEQSSPNASVDTPVSAEPSSGLKEVKGSERGSDGTGSPPRTSSPSAPSSASKNTPRSEPQKPFSLNKKFKDRPISEEDLKNSQIKLTYLFENVNDDSSFAKYKLILRRACRYSFFGRFEEGLRLFQVVKEQVIAKQYKEMIETNMKDISNMLKKYYLIKR